MRGYVDRIRARDDGAVAVIAALVLTVLLLFSALVIDLGALRADRSLGQSVSDMSAAAAALAYEPQVAGSARDACLQAVAYAETNLGVTLSADGPGCNVFPLDAVCQEGNVRRALYSGGDFEMMIINPVVAGDDDGLLRVDVQAEEPDIDGIPCERIGVRISRDRGFLLAGAGGAITEGRTNVGAVSVSKDGDIGEFASLIVLERNGCQTLSNAGGANIRVFDLETQEPDEDGVLRDVTYPGTITVDTLPQGCSGNQKIIQARTSTGALVEATGRIVAHSLQSVDRGNAVSYPTAAVPANLRSGKTAPFDPERGARITRQPVDDAVNCHPGGYPSGFTWSPDRFGQDIPACEEGSDGTYIKDLKDAIGGITTATQATTAGWAVYPNATQSCGGGGTVTPAQMGADQLFVNCVETGNPSFDPDGLELVGFSHIVFRETMRIGSGQELEIRGDAVDGTVVYFPTGGIDHRGGDLRMRNVFVYIDAPGSGGAKVVMTGTADNLSWQAPLDVVGGRTVKHGPEACSEIGDGLGTSAPSAACFSPLALWSNGSAENALQGNGGGGIIGSMFTPNAPFKLRGSAGLTEDPCNDEVTWADLLSAEVTNVLNFESAQFFARRLDTAGGGVVRLCPSPSTTFDVPITGTGLIR